MPQTKEIHKGHRARMRDRIIKVGMEGLNEHELLEYLLFFAIPRRDVNETAHLLLDSFGDLAQVMDAPVDELCEIPGVNKHTALFLHCLPEVLARYQRCKTELKNTLYTMRQACDYCYKRIGNCTEEKLLVLCLNVRKHIIFALERCSDSPDAVRVDASEVVALAVKKRAHFVLTAHNHPSGELKPSCNDYLFASELSKCFNVLNMRYLDNIIVSPLGALSFTCATGRMETTGTYELKDLKELSEKPTE